MSCAGLDRRLAVVGSGREHPRLRRAGMQARSRPRMFSLPRPAERNYFWMVAGQNFGVLDDADPSSHHLAATSHIADQLELAGLGWKAYQESMGEPCGLTSHGRYAAKHNPFAYFDDINGWDGK